MKTPGYFIANRASNQAIGLAGWWPGQPNDIRYWRNCAPNAAAPSTDGILALNFYPMSGDTGWTAGKDGGFRALKFKALASTSVLATGVPSFSSSSFSICLWARWTSTGTTVGDIQALWDNGHDTGKGFVIQDRPDLSKKLSFFVGGSSSVESTGQVGDGTWHHIACTYDGTNARMYIDGRLDNTAATTAGTQQTLFYWGRTQNFSRYLTGTLEDARLYRKVLSAADIWSIYDIRTRGDLRYVPDRKIYSTPLIPLSCTTTDAPTLSESIDWVATLNRTTADAPTISEDANASKTFIRAATDSPTISESILVSFTASKTGTDAPVISESIVTQKTLFRSLSQSLTITQSHLVATPVQFVEQGLSLSQSVAVVTELSKSASNTLNFSQAADYFQFVPLETDNTLTITQTVDVLQTTGVGNVLTITQDVAVQYDPHLDQRFQTLVPAQTVTIAAIFNRSLEQTVTLAHSVAYLKIIEVSASNTLTVLQSLVGGPLRNAHNELDDLDQEVVRDVYRNKSLNQTLAVTQSVGLQMILNRSLTSTLLFKDEHPVPDGAGGIIQVPNVIVTQGGKTTEIECCPIPSRSIVYQSASRSIVMSNPEFNDTEGLVAAVSIKRTITGCTYSYVKKSANRKLKYKFVINQKKAFELRRFLLDFLGDRIQLTNFHGEIWTGYILTDPAEITSSSRGGICNGDLYQIELEFQGVKVN